MKNVVQENKGWKLALVAASVMSSLSAVAARADGIVTDETPDRHENELRLSGTYSSVSAGGGKRGATGLALRYQNQFEENKRESRFFSSAHLEGGFAGSGSSRQLVGSSGLLLGPTFGGSQFGAAIGALRGELGRNAYSLSLIEIGPLAFNESDRVRGRTALTVGGGFVGPRGLKVPEGETAKPTSRLDTMVNLSTQQDIDEILRLTGSAGFSRGKGQSYESVGLGARVTLGPVDLGPEAVWTRFRKDYTASEGGPVVQHGSQETRVMLTIGAHR